VNTPIHPRIETVALVAEGLVHVAQTLARVAARRAPAIRAGRFATLRPGAATPLWNALVVAVRAQLRRRGEKSNLARELGVPPQRVHEYFVARTAAPDAERTLVVLHWLATRPAPASRPRGGRSA
jgi:hypothetical protein